MYKLIKRVSLLVLALTFGSNAFASSSTQADLKTEDIDTRKVVVKQYKWFGDSPRAKHIRIINPFGSVTSRTTTYNNVELSGAIQLIGEKPAIHQIDVRDNKGVTEVIVNYPDGIRNEKGQLTGRFDLGVWVPSWVTVEVETDFGDIKVKRSASNVIAKSNSGKISIGTMGDIDAYTQDGNISIDLYNEAYKQGLKVHSATGDVKVRLSKNANVLLNAQAKKDITHNFADFDSVKVVNQPNGLLATIVPENTGKAKTQEFEVFAPKGKINLFVQNKPTHNVQATPNYITKKVTPLELKQAASK